MKEFKATDYLKKTDDETLVDIIQFWKDWKGTSSEKDIYDLKSEEGFKHFVDKYGIENTINFYNKGQYYLDGNDYKSPFQLTHDYMFNLINVEYNIEFFKVVKEIEHSLVCIEGWFNTDDIEKIINTPNNYFMNTYCFPGVQWDEIPQRVAGR